ncbi:MAG: hypothetical protein IJ234_09910 [Clostridia bacterium]|nr:hypothetical protein [Clostridia bacterium]
MRKEWAGERFGGKISLGWAMEVSNGRMQVFGWTEAVGRIGGEVCLAIRVFGWAAKELGWAKEGFGQTAKGFWSDCGWS